MATPEKANDIVTKLIEEERIGRAVQVDGIKTRVESAYGFSA